MGKRSSAFDLSECARPNILSLTPYRCARDDYKDDGTNVLLDANENAYGPGLNLHGRQNLPPKSENGSRDLGIDNFDLSGLHRYPDPHQTELKQLLCQFRNTHHHTDRDLSPDNLFVGVGSDEVIDALLRCFCRPGHDRILTCPPTYGMYAVSAQINDIDIVKVPLDVDNAFNLRADAINQALFDDTAIKLVYVCSPGNPTASLIKKSDLEAILDHPSWNGVVVLDEAYIDFSPEGSSLAEWVLEWPNLVVMQTLSKAFGLAGIRLGAAFTSPQIARLLNNLKAPYNISSPTSALACGALQAQNIEVMRSNREKIIGQKERMLNQLPLIPGVGRFLGGQDSNFLLTEILDRPKERGGRPCNTTALAVYERLAETRGVVVRFRGKEHGCTGCLRVTVGTESEVDTLLKQLRLVLSDILRDREPRQDEMNAEHQQETNDIIA